MDVKIFHSVSITGRYIYGYLCLRRTIDTLHSTQLPRSLDRILRTFTEAEFLDEWHEDADRCLPSKVMNKEDGSEVPGDGQGVVHENLVEYYSSQPKIIIEILEDLFWIGMSNLYGGFNSNISFPYIQSIILLMGENNIPYPDIDILTRFPSSDMGGWGERTSISNIISDN